MRLERMVDAERDARIRLEKDFEAMMSETRRTVHALREELASVATTIYQLAPRNSVANPLDVLGQQSQSLDVEPWARSVQRETRRLSEVTAKGLRISKIDLHKIEGKLGVGLGGGDGAIPLHVQSIVPGSAAAVDGRLQLGDRILKIDGFHVDRASYEGAVALLRTTDEVVVFEVAREGSAEYNTDQDASLYAVECNSRNILTQHPD